LATLLGAWAQMLQGGLSAWGGLAVIGTLVTVAAIAWAQSDINYLKSKERRNGR
jgi:prolipoprotein diacylglyceryltransferase